MQYGWHLEASLAPLSSSSLSPINWCLHSIMTFPKTQICRLLPSIPPPPCGPASIIPPPGEAVAASLVTPLLPAPTVFPLHCSHFSFIIFFFFLII